MPDTPPATSRESSTHILLVDDDPGVAESLALFLEMRGWKVTVARTGDEALDCMKRQRDLDLVLLDINLPDRSGFEVLERSQDLGVVAPVIVVSTRTEDRDQLRAFGLGAQDYFTKPFDPDTLVERIQSILGDAGAALSSTECCDVGSAVVDLERNEVRRDGITRKLPEPQRNLLLVLLRNRGRTVSGKRLLKEALGADEDAAMLTFTRRGLREMLRSEVERLQEIVESDPDHPEHIVEVYGQGYRLQ